MTVIEARIVGIKFHPGGMAQLRNTPSRTLAVLKREPGNPHDRNAVKVCFGNLDVGYVERDAAARIAPLIDEGKPLRASLRGMVRLRIDLDPQQKCHGGAGRGVNGVKTGAKVDPTLNDEVPL